VHSKLISDPHYFTLEDQVESANYCLLGESTVELWRAIEMSGMAGMEQRFAFCGDPQPFVAPS
jgi:hypothetical protein